MVYKLQLLLFLEIGLVGFEIDKRGAWGMDNLRVLALANLFDENSALISIGMSYAFLNYIGGKLVLREREHAAFEFVNNARFVLRCAVFQDVLDYIVSVLVLNQSFRVLVKFF